ncbi:MAG: diguanylate cyclase [Candidatus Omnitrophota bacterium]|nr:diguanylate cyclase [Candidatus Omnitrophota bacterium]
MRSRNKMALVSRGLRYKLLIAFTLMSIIPLLSCVYVISLYVFPQIDSLLSASSVVLISIFIALLGLLLARSLVDPVINMAIEARIIADGQYDKNLIVHSDDEIGNIASSINTMTQKIKVNLDEIKSYGQKMKEVNADVHKKVLALSNLLQIGDVISAGSVQIDSLLEMALGKATMLFDASFGIIYAAKDDESDFVPRIDFGPSGDNFREITIKRKGRGILEQAIEGRSILIIDGSLKMSEETRKFASEHNVKNILAMPIYSGKKAFGILVIGSNVDSYKYRSEDIEIARVFTKQITIAIENDILNKKMEELAVRDELTGLYNKNFILNRLGEEIKRAIFYQRPCSFIIFGVDSFADFRKTHGELAAEEALKKLARIMKDNTMPVGKAARISGDEFAILLPEKNKKESFTIAEEIRKKVESANFLKSGNALLTVCGGVSENPIDGTTVEELLEKAVNLLKEARASGPNKVIA